MNTAIVIDSTGDTINSGKMALIAGTTTGHFDSNPQLTVANSGNTWFELDNFGTGSNVFITRKSRGTQADPTTLNDEDRIVFWGSSGADDTQPDSIFRNAAAISIYVDGVPTAGTCPMRINFETGNTTNRTEALNITSTQQIEVPNGSLHILNNSNKIYLGKNDDASIYFDGTDLNINLENPSISGSIKFNDDIDMNGDVDISGDLTMSGPEGMIDLTGDVSNDLDHLIKFGAGLYSGEAGLQVGLVGRSAVDDDGVILTFMQKADTDSVLGAGAAGDTNRRFVIRADGQLKWGGGSGAQDVNLYRVNSTILKTDDSFQANALTASGGNVTCLTTFVASQGPPASGGPGSGLAYWRDLTGGHGSSRALYRDTSSRKYKKHIADLDEDSDVIQELRAVKFKPLIGQPGTGDLCYGFIAEEVAEVCDKMVFKNSKKEPEGLQWNVITTFLVKEVQRLQKEIDLLKVI